jgi:hypothetical protein
MNDAELVRVSEAACHLLYDRVEALRRADAVAVQLLTQRDAAHVLEDQVRSLRVVYPDVQEAHDVFVLETAEQLRFTLEAP